MKPQDFYDLNHIYILPHGMYCDLKLDLEDVMVLIHLYQEKQDIEITANTSSICE